MHGYTLEEIDAVASELLHSLLEREIPTRLAVLALCKVIAVVGDEDDLDIACYAIDRFSELAEETDDGDEDGDPEEDQ